MEIDMDSQDISLHQAFIIGNEHEFGIHNIFPLGKKI